MRRRKKATGRRAPHRMHGGGDRCRRSTRTLRARGSCLHVRARADAGAHCSASRRRPGAEAVFWTRRYEPAIEARDATIKRALRRAGLHAESHNGALLIEPVGCRDESRRSVQGVHAVLENARARCCGSRGRGMRRRDCRRYRSTSASRRSTCSAAADACMGRRLLDALDARRSRRTRGAAMRSSRTSPITPKHATCPPSTAPRRLSPHLHFGEVSIQRVFAAIGECDAPPEARAAYSAPTRLARIRASPAASLPAHHRSQPRRALR